MSDTPRTDHLCAELESSPLNLETATEHVLDLCRDLEAEAARLKAHRDTVWRSANVLHQAIAVFLKDWRDDDFGLPTLARIHVLSIEEKYCELGKALSAKEETK